MPPSGLHAASLRASTPPPPSGLHAAAFLRASTPPPSGLHAAASLQDPRRLPLGSTPSPPSRIQPPPSGLHAAASLRAPRRRSVMDSWKLHATWEKSKVDKQWTMLSRQQGNELESDGEQEDPCRNGGACHPQSPAFRQEMAAPAAGHGHLYLAANTISLYVRLVRRDRLMMEDDDNEQPKKKIRMGMPVTQ